MARIDLESITDPISEEQPCGPDLDMEFDMDFMNFVAEIEGVIPTRFFGFEPSSLDFDGYSERIGDFLERTRDLRLLVPLAKLRVLRSDLGGFAEVLDATHRLLTERWSDLHPQPAEFLELGMGQLSTLDDMPNVVLPLQHATIVRSRRAGAITLRKWQVAHGEVNPREGEETVDASLLAAGLADADAGEIAKARESLARARDAVAGIRTVCIREAGFDKAPQLERLPAALEAAVAMIDTATGGAAAGAEAVEAGAAEGGAGTGAAGTAVVQLPTGAVSGREEAVEAMHVAARYFALREPSSPVPMLLREAQAATSKTFYELINDLVPDSAASAFISLGREPWFDVYVSTLDSRNPPPDYAPEEDAEAAAEAAGLDDGEEPGDVGGEGTESTDGASDTAGIDAEEMTGSAEGADEAAPDDGGAPEEEPSAGPHEAADAAAPAAPPRPKFAASSRPEAIALLEKVLAYYRVAEPSSPVPLLVERAIEMSSKSFIELLGKVLPKGSLNETPREG